MKNKNACRGCIGSNYYEYGKDTFPRTGKYPMLEKYGNIIGEEFGAYVLTLTINGYSDNEISMLLGIRWSYLFKGLTWADWFQMVEEFRETQK